MVHGLKYIHTILTRGAAKKIRRIGQLPNRQQFNMFMAIDNESLLLVKKEMLFFFLQNIIFNIQQRIKFKPYLGETLLKIEYCVLNSHYLCFYEVLSTKPNIHIKIILGARAWQIKKQKEIENSTGKRILQKKNPKEKNLNKVSFRKLRSSRAQWHLIEKTQFQLDI